MTRSQINKLGRELRKAPVPDSETLMRLQGFRQSFDAPMAATQEQLRSRLNVQATSRLKTINTIIDKLNREKTPLIAQIETSQTNVSKGREQLEAMSEQLAEKGWQDGIVEARFLLDDASAALEGSFRTAQGILKELIARMEAR